MRRIGRLVRRVIIDAILAIVIIGNLMEFAQLLPPKLNVLEKLLGIIMVTYLVYKINLPRILAGTRNRAVNISLIAAYYLVISNVLLLMRLNELNQFSDILATYLMQHIDIIIIAGVIMLALISLAIALFSNIGKQSLLAVIGQEGRPKSAIQMLLRFVIIFFLLFSFSYIAFKPLIEWLSLAIDAPLLMAAIAIFLFAALSHHKKLTIEKIIKEPEEMEEGFFERFFRHFGAKRYVLYSISGLLVLNSLVDAFVFILPNDFYMQSMSIAGHQPFSYYIIKEIAYLGTAGKTGLAASYGLNALFMFIVLAMPAYIWYKLVTRKEMVFGKAINVLFFASLAAYLLMPAYTIGWLKTEQVIGADVRIRSVIGADFVINKIVQNQEAALLAVLAIAAVVALAAYLLSKKWAKPMSLVIVAIAMAFFGMHLYSYIYSTAAYAFEIAGEAGKAAITYWSADAIKISLLSIALIFYIAVFVLFVWEIIQQYGVLGKHAPKRGAVKKEKREIR